LKGRKFLVLIRRFTPPERTYIYILALWRYFVRLFLRHSRRCEALSISAFCGNSIVRSHFANTSHKPFAFARDACSVFASYSLGGLMLFPLFTALYNNLRYIFIYANICICLIYAKK
jgi:hypothetical protein